MPCMHNLHPQCASPLAGSMLAAVAAAAGLAACSRASVVAAAGTMLGAAMATGAGGACTRRGLPDSAAGMLWPAEAARSAG